jgi:hypothetical protein
MLVDELRIPTALLLPLNWLGGDARGKWLRAVPMYCPDLYVLPNRPSFTADGATDSLNYAWMVWDPGNDRRPTWTVLDSTPADERRRDHEAQFGADACTLARAELRARAPRRLAAL